MLAISIYIFVNVSLARPRIYRSTMHSLSFRTALNNLKSTLLEIGEPRQLVVSCPACGDNKIIMARQVKKEDVETNPAFAEFLQVSRNNSPTNSLRRRKSSASWKSTRSRGSCRYKNTPGHICGRANSSSRRSSSKHRSVDDIPTTELTATKNGSNGRANSIHLMESRTANGEHAEAQNVQQPTLRERWQNFMEERDDYSLWIWPPQHR